MADILDFDAAWLERRGMRRKQVWVCGACNNDQFYLGQDGEIYCALCTETVDGLRTVVEDDEADT